MRAILSDCGTWRYLLERDVADTGLLGMFCWVNPSTADAEKDDASSRKGIGFATRLGWRGYKLVNPSSFKEREAKANRELRRRRR